MAIIFDISKDAAVARHYVLLDCLLMPKFHTGGQLVQLILCDGGHDGQTKFGVLVKGIDVVVLEKDTYSRTAAVWYTGWSPAYYGQSVRFPS